MSDKFEYIEFTVSGNSLKTEAHGFEGNGCVKATEGIEKAMSSGEIRRKYKPSFFKSVVNKIKGKVEI